MSEPTQRLFTCKDYQDVMYMVIPKAGCTFVKNLLWKINNHGIPHDPPNRVHDSDKIFPRASQFGWTTEQVRNSDHAFTVLRSPIERFISLYFDKIIGDGYKRFVPLRSVLCERFGLNVDASTDAEHTSNCKFLITWLKENLDSRNELERDPHWTPLSWRYDAIKKFDLKLLMLENLDEKLSILLNDRIPNFERYVVGTERYSSDRKVSRSKLIDAELEQMIGEVYRDDMWFTYTVWRFWDERKPTNHTEIPRASNILK